MKIFTCGVLLLGLSTSVYALPELITCTVNPDDQGNSTIVALLDDTGNIIKEYDEARGKSSGSGSGWFHHPTVPADYRSPDHSAEYTKEIRRVGGFLGFGGREVLEGYKCLTGGPTITLKEVYPDSSADEIRYKPEFNEETGEPAYLREHEIDPYIEGVRISDGSLQDLGLEYVTEFTNCQEIK